MSGSSGADCDARIFSSVSTSSSLGPPQPDRKRARRNAAIMDFMARPLSGAARIGKDASFLGPLQRVAGAREGYHLFPALSFAGKAEQASEAGRDGGTLFLQGCGGLIEFDRRVADRDEALVVTP